MSQPSLLVFMLLSYYDFGCVVSCLDEERISNNISKKSVSLGICRVV